MKASAASPRFPAPLGESQTHPDDASPAGEPALPKRVLFIDDNPDVREVCGELLRRVGFHVSLAVDGESGWDMITSNPFDLVITDHNMPRLSGLDLVRRIRTLSSTLPVILVSGNVPWDEPDLQWTLRPGVVVQKPFGFAELISNVEDLLRASTHRRDNGQVAPSPRFIPSPLAEVPSA